MLYINFDPFPVLTTERLILRRIDENDAKEIFLLRSDENIMKYICKPKPKNLDDVLPLVNKINKLIDGNEGIAWAMTLKDDPKMMGHISFHVFYKEHFRAEVGYMMHPDHYGKGLMDEALKAVLSFGFNKVGLHSVEANVSPENSASRKLLERNNFKQEAHFKENFYWEGQFLDSIIYSLLRPR
jgi:[ribosomal protein S5]-alanine N-acetyltransferase